MHEQCVVDVLQRSASHPCHLRPLPETDHPAPRDAEPEVSQKAHHEARRPVTPNLPVVTAHIPEAGRETTQGQGQQDHQEAHGHPGLDQGQEVGQGRVEGQCQDRAQGVLADQEEGMERDARFIMIY